MSHLYPNWGQFCGQACLRSCAKELGNLHGGILGPSGSDVELLRVSQASNRL